MLPFAFMPMVRCMIGFEWFVAGLQSCSALQVHVAVNQIVEEDDLLVTLKPRVADAAPLDVTAPAPGRIIELSAAPGRRVAENAWLAAISDN